MKILTINYPKDSNDNKKIEFFKSNYDSYCLPKIFKESEENVFDAI
jgi:hypothetical protein